MTDAYPLNWPDGWPRTPLNQRVDGRYHFKRVTDEGGRVPWIFVDARQALLDEIRRIGGGEVVVTSDIRLNQSGLPSGGRARPDDQGIAVYFKRGARHMAMACDRYDRAEENMRSLTLVLEAMRQLERHGGGAMAEKAFTGFTALPPPKTCWEILGLAPGSSERAIRAAWRDLAAAAHPDAGGSNAAMAELNAARDEALRRVAAA